MLRKNSTDSVLSSQDLFSSFTENLLLSTSPCVFNEISITLTNIEIEEEDIEKVKKKFQIVLKDIIIISLKKKLDKYRLGYTVYMSLLGYHYCSETE